ncbi:hypothetical protein [Actinacidiphila paucisporea]|uniref:Uncharacterized protein n=1 Tax=Actinacidiphila paucisporea TaxID=310782 RepID=A0A1M6YKY7_9ACTN|nr:hypothetical protein [Actinacidiphila paucisporea]SHL18790.1 hypothetical protein SAMN05216499_10325 [Actinacidiphila paucisporea]
MEPRVVVEPQGRDGGRRVRVGAQILGIAYGSRDLLEFLRRAGLEDIDQLDLASTDLIDWQGGGPAVWD